MDPCRTFAPSGKPGHRGWDRAGRAGPAGLAVLLACWLAGAVFAESDFSAPSCDYRVELTDPAARNLVVHAECRSERPLELRPRSTLLRRHLEALHVNGQAVADPDMFDWVLAPVEGRARFRYRIDLDSAAAESGSVEGARRLGASVIAPLHGWLLGPADPRAELSLRFLAPAGGDVLTGLPPTAEGAFRLRGEDLDFAGYALLGTFRVHRLDLPAAPQAPGQGLARITLGLPDKPFARTDAELLEWVRRSALVAAAQWGGMPSRHSLLLLVPEPDVAGVVFGRVRGGGGATAYMALGEFTLREQLYASWELIHELMHLGSPFIPDGYWFMEGFATYAEAVAQARAGWRSEHSVWGEFLRDMPRGLPALTNARSAAGQAPSGRGPGIDGRTVDAVYWGGALFMLLADVAIRVQSGNRLGLMDCFLAVLEDGGDAAHRRALAQALAACNAATGGEAVAGLYRRQVRERRPLDLEALWQDLGVHATEGGVRLDDRAPLAHLRRSITAPFGTVPMPQQPDREG